MGKRHCGDSTEIQQATCEGKAALSFSVAKRRAGAKARRSFYKCPFCKRWHIGGFGPIRSGRKWKRKNKGNRNGN